ncbi:bifunctional o-acetylhomoserine/o-acetylserine sulfhydrylase [Glutamicibacter uratoxydans]|uniref:bifunctional o-acetylhomoserine/o-acetylserine sulfhydrylase n=1 Tax=Glutamicibacter uratoxydans TaxID=43667 RepID=UPI003D6E5EFE
MSDNWSFETRQIHAGQTPDPQTGARALPIYQSTSFVFPDAQTAADRFALQDLGPIYTRIGNPTQEAVENRIASLEGGVGALLLASGQAATTFAILNLAETGDHIVASPSLYGGTQNLFKHTLKKLGIAVTFVSDPDDLQAWKAAIQPNTKALFGEVVSNPRQDVLEISAIAEIAHAAGIPLLVDNTLSTPFLIRPIEFGADIVIHSATKYLGGHGTAIAGVIVDSGNFDFAANPEKFPGFNTPDESYNNLVFARDLGVNGILGANLAYILKARVQLLRDLGSAVSPFNAFLIAQGLETLSLRMERHVSNAVLTARWLEAHPQVEQVAYAGLESSPWFERGRKYGPNGTGAIVSFDLAGGAEAGRAFVDALELHSNVANLGDVRSLVVHPASTTHAQLTAEERAAAGVRDGLVRLSVGLENVKDILADLELGFAAVAAQQANNLAESH